MSKHLLSCVCLASVGMAVAQTMPPSVEEMAGDYVIMNYKENEGQKLLADMKDMRIDAAGHDALKFSGFYMTDSEDFAVAYDPQSGKIAIPSGTQVLGGDSGFEQYLYLWNEDKDEVMNSDIEYLLQEDGTWKAAPPIVLMSGVEGGQLSPYYFSNESVICRANAETANVSYVGWGAEQEVYIESRPSYVRIEKNKITVYNLLQKDQYGYGCYMEGTYTDDGRVLFKPVLVGQSNDGTYKVLAGCLYDEQENRPTDITDAGGRSEGVVRGTIDLDAGVLELEPMAIWTASLHDSLVIIDSDRRYYEFVKSVKVTFEPLSTSSVENIESDGAKEVLRVEYFNSAGQRISAPCAGSFTIKRTIYKNHLPETEKIYIR